jgi:hypothetical protein
MWLLLLWEVPEGAGGLTEQYTGMQLTAVLGEEGRLVAVI